MTNYLWGVDEQIAADLLAHLTAMELVVLQTIYTSGETKIEQRYAAKKIGISASRVSQLSKNGKTKLAKMVKRIREHSNNDADYYKHIPGVMW